MNPEYQEEDTGDESLTDSDFSDDFSPDSESSDNEPIVDPDPYIGLSIADYRVFDKSVNSTYMCRNVNTDEVHICSIIKVEDYFHFNAIRQKAEKFPGLNKVIKVVTQGENNLVIYQKTYGDVHEYAKGRVEIDQRETANLFYQMVRTVRDSFLHGLLLRDIKMKRWVFTDPSRTLICYESWEDSVLLTDPNNDTLTQRWSCSTYASPEVLDPQVTSFSGEKVASWSLGVIFYGLLAGKYPFFHKDQTIKTEMIRRGDFAMPPNVNPEAITLLNNILTKNVSLRFTTSEILTSNYFTVYALGDPSMVEFYRCPPTCELPTHGHATSTHPVPHHVAAPFNPPNVDQVVPDIDRPETL